MQNAFWYLLICLLSICIFIYSLWKKRDIKLVGLYLFMSGLTYAFEYVILVIFDSYVYYPGILPVGYFDNIMGAVISDAFSVPMASVFVASFQLSYKKHLIVTAVILGVEELFLHLDIYRHHWWNIAYTGIGLTVGFIIAKRCITLLHQHMKWYTRFVAVFFISLVIHSSLVFILCGILNMYIYRIQWFEDMYRGHIAFATAYIFIQAFIFSLSVVPKFKWLNATMGLFILTGSDVVLLNSNILIFIKSWNLFYFILLRIFILSSLFFIDRRILESPGDINIIDGDTSAK